MQQQTETILDRRRMRRRLSRWRGAAITAVALTIGLLAFGSEKLGSLVGKQQIARIAIEGTITDDRDQLAMIKKIKEDKHVQGVIVFVNSPGGTTTGGEALFEALRDLAKEKPVVAQFGTVAASAGYIVGLATDYIIARGNTITGSIGVLAQWPEVSELLDKLGVKMAEVKSGELKASPSPFEPMTEGARKVMEETINDGFRWFLSLVEGRRGIAAADIPGLADGRIYSGREAVARKLVDEIGGEAEAKLWLEEKRGVAKDLDIVDWKPVRSEGSWLTGSATRLGSALLGEGAGQLARVLARDPSFATLGLDGLVSVWQPSEN